jgi:hypothetical protein
MPIYTHEIKSSLRRGVTALPLFGSAATNTLVLGLLIVLVVVAICVIFVKLPPGMGEGKAGTARYITRCAIYATPAVLLLLYVYSGAIAATVEGAGAADVADFVGTAPRMRQDVAAGRGNSAAFPVPSPTERTCGAEDPTFRPTANSAGGSSSISAQLATIERNLPQAVQI